MAKEVANVNSTRLCLNCKCDGSFNYKSVAGVVQDPIVHGKAKKQIEKITISYAKILLN